MKAKQSVHSKETLYDSLSLPYIKEV